MKIFKNIVRLLVLTSLSLSASPLTTAKAADTVVKDSKDSTVSVTVLSGILTLDAVPDFSFGSMMPGTTAKLASNTIDASELEGNSNVGEDGNSSGILQMTDSRNLTTKENIPGFTLSAAITELQGADGSTMPVSLTLNPLPLLNEKDENISTSSTDLMTNKSVISSEMGSTNDIIDLGKGEYNPGIIRAKFNTPDSASLTIPTPKEGIGNVKQAKNMNAVVTWTLTAKPSVTN